MYDQKNNLVFVQWKSKVSFSCVPKNSAWFRRHIVIAGITITSTGVLSSSLALQLTYVCCKPATRQ